MKGLLIATLIMNLVLSVMLFRHHDYLEAVEGRVGALSAHIEVLTDELENQGFNFKSKSEID